MEGLLLVAASGLAREVLAVERVLGQHHPMRLLDDNPELWGTTMGGAPVVGGLEQVEKYDDCTILVCAGQGSTRRQLVDRLAELGVDDTRYACVIHPSVEVPDGCLVGAGSVVLAQVALTADVTVGRHVVVMPNVTLTHDDVVEDFATLCAGVSLGGRVHVGSCAYLGMNATVRECVRVGEAATLGMGSALVQDLPSAETWVGVPAHPLGSPRAAAVMSAP